MFADILPLINDWRTGFELEASILGSDVNIITFQNCLSNLLHMFKYDNLIQTDDVLDVSCNNNDIRYSIKGSANISTYCKRNELPASTTAIQKNRIRHTDISDLNMRVKLSSERNSPIKNIRATSADIKNQHKHFRLKKRVSILSTDRKYSFDFTIVKSSSGLSLLRSTDKKEKREFECEYVGKTKPIFEEFKSNLEIMMRMYFNDPLLTPLSTKHNILRAYLKIALPKMKNLNSTTINDIVKRVSDEQKNLPIGTSKIDPKKYFMGPQPVTLELSNLKSTTTLNILSDYSVTPKADGERSLIFIYEDHVWLINNRLNVLSTGIRVVNFNECIFDAEIVKHDIYLFDCYICEGDTYKLPLQSRLQKCEILVTQATSNTNTYTLHKKDFFIEESIYIACNKSFDESYDFETDGLIFTPLKEPPALFGTWDSVMKWKPPDQNSIDFLVKFKKDQNGNDIVFVEDDGLKYKTLDLYIGSTPTTPQSFFENPEKKYVAQPFKKDGYVAHRIQVLADAPKCLNQDEIVDNSVVEMTWISPSFVPYRVRYDKTWAANSYNITANNIKTANNVWSSILNPITKDHLLGKIRDETIIVQDSEDSKYYSRKGDRSDSLSLPMINFHNMWVKSEWTMKLLAERGGCKTLADVACGKAGDMNKWLKNNYTSVLGIDISEDNIINNNDGAYKRLSEMIKYHQRNYKYVFLPMDSSKVYDVTKIKDEYTRELAEIVFGKSIPAKESAIKHLHNFAKTKFDVVSCQFALHYFFKDESSVRNFIENLDSLIKPGGFFVGTCFDGNSVAQMFQTDDKVSGEKNNKMLWSIEKKYKRYNQKAFGQEIEVYVETINKVHSEYLVPFELLVDLLAKKNIHPLSQDSLERLNIEKSTYMFKELFTDMNSKMAPLISDPHANQFKTASEMSRDEQKFSFLNRWFIFEKINV